MSINEIDVSDWKNNTVYDSYSLYDSTITYFWMFVNELTSQIPATGYKDLQGNAGNKNDLPVRQTCFNHIDLPPYSSYAMLKQKNDESNN
ncbi:ITCH protein [Neocallimastix lanati (nom. inval.)]|nr:ITCH protein [Neocallimastix sp. JGI-2020a]